jgi:dCMP deaminase
MSTQASSDGDPEATCGVVSPDNPAWAKHDFYMRLAGVVESGAKCLGSRVGAVAVRDDRVLGMGYNGTPSGYPNCTEQERGCRRCALRHDARAGVLTGRLYDICLCVHAEQNVVVTAARFGVALADAWVYTTLQPCFGCLKELMQLRVRGIVFLRPWTAHHPDYGWVEAEYAHLVTHYRARAGFLARLETGAPVEPVGASIGGPPA